MCKNLKTKIVHNIFHVELEIRKMVRLQYSHTWSSHTERLSLVEPPFTHSVGWKVHLLTPKNGPLVLCAAINLEPRWRPSDCLFWILYISFLLYQVWFARTTPHVNLWNCVLWNLGCPMPKVGDLGPMITCVRGGRALLLTPLQMTWYSTKWSQKNEM